MNHVMFPWNAESLSTVKSLCGAKCMALATTCATLVLMDIAITKFIIISHVASNKCL